MLEVGGGRHQIGPGLHGVGGDPEIVGGDAAAPFGPSRVDAAMHDPEDLARDMAERLAEVERQLDDVEAELAAARQYEPPERAELYGDGGGVVTAFVRWLIR